MSKELVNPFGPVERKVYYMKGVNMTRSFDSLAKIAKDSGAQLRYGDVLVVDNEKGDKRKMMRWTPRGFVLIYMRLDTAKFSLLPTKKSLVTNPVREMIGYTS